MTIRLEHANICVRNIDDTIRFLQTAFPEFRIRGEGVNPESGLRWLHLGNDDTYIGLNQAKPGATSKWSPYAGEPGTNHLAYVVDDVETVRSRLVAAGYRISGIVNGHPHRKRVYFYDSEENDWEFVQYLSQDPAKRNDYALPEA